ncbi:MAG: YfhO family protein [Fimbriiglobus sp.]
MLSGGRRTTRRLAQWAVVLAGAVGFQGILYWPSLTGQKVLLPLGLLARGTNYLPPTGAPHPDSGQSPVFGDLVFHGEYVKRSVAREFAAGRLPVWDPCSFAGVPYANVGKFSPFLLVTLVVGSPLGVAWEAVAKAVVATAGAFWFFRREIGVRFWPAAVGAWCLPLTAFHVLWQGFGVSSVAVWLPALLAAVGMTVRRPTGWGPAAVAGVTAAAVLCGQLDVAGQVLIVSAGYLVWSVVRRYGPRVSRRAVVAVLAVGVGWAAGLGVSAPYWMPATEYAKSGQRLARRGGGAEERPPGGPADLLLFLSADWAGSHSPGTHYFRDGNQLEGAGAGYAGLAALFVAAPLAWLGRRHRSSNRFWTAAGLLGLCWVCGVPGVVSVLRLPGLNMFSHNRLVFVSGFAVLTLAVTGLNAVWAGGWRWRPGFWFPAVGLAVFGLAAVVRAGELPAEFETLLRTAPPAIASDIRGHLTAGYLVAAAVAFVGLGAWAAAGLGRPRPWLPRAVAAVMVLELLAWAHGKNAQSDPELYYPPLPAVDAVREAADGRAIALMCLPANLPQMLGVREVRGYDGVDPRPVVDLMDRVRSTADSCPPYARTQFFLPRIAASPAGLSLPPALDMLGVKYVITPSAMLAKTTLSPAWVKDGYAVYMNPRALPRAFVPRRVVVRADPADILRAVGSDDFAPADVAYVSEKLSVSDEAEGTATVDEPEPTRIIVTADMKTTGLVVLADQWADGWTATVDGTPAPVVWVNYAVKGVVVPAGRHAVEFRYWPPALTTGLRLAVGGLVLLLGWAVLGRRAFTRWIAPTRRPGPSA